MPTLKNLELFAAYALGEGVTQTELEAEVQEQVANAELNRIYKNAISVPLNATDAAIITALTTKYDSSTPELTPAPGWVVPVNGSKVDPEGKPYTREFIFGTSSWSEIYPYIKPATPSNGGPLDLAAAQNFYKLPKPEDIVTKTAAQDFTLPVTAPTPNGTKLKEVINVEYFDINKGTYTIKPLSSAATITLDFNSGEVKPINLTGNVTINIGIVNAIPQMLVLSAGTTARTITFHANILDAQIWGTRSFIIPIGKKAIINLVATGTGIASVEILYIIKP